LNLSSNSAFALARAATAAGSSLTLQPEGRQAACAFGANHIKVKATTEAVSVFMGGLQLGQVGVKFIAFGANSLGFPAIS